MLNLPWEKSYVREIKTNSLKSLADFNWKQHIFYVRVEVFTAVTMKNAVFWHVAPCRFCVNRHFGGTYSLHLQPPTHAGSSPADFSTLKMEAIHSSETSVYTRPAGRHISEEGIQHIFYPRVDLLYVYHQEVLSSIQWSEFDTRRFGRPTYLYIAFQTGGPGSSPNHVMWDLWWTKWHLNRFSPSTSVSPANLHSTNCFTITIVYNLGLVQ
jgi:hypothetical protein